MRLITMTMAALTESPPILRDHGEGAAAPVRFSPGASILVIALLSLGLWGLILVAGSALVDLLR